MAKSGVSLNQYTGRLSDLFVVLAVVLIVIMMVLPLPPFVLDLLLAVNISLSLLILLISMSIRKRLEMLRVPSLLLITTSSACFGRLLNAVDFCHCHRAVHRSLRGFRSGRKLRGGFCDLPDPGDRPVIVTPKAPRGWQK